MFGKLKDKLKNWTKGLIKKAKEIPGEKIGGAIEKKIIEPPHEKRETVTEILEKGEEKKAGMVLERFGIESQKIEKPEIKEKFEEVIKKAKLVKIKTPGEREKEESEKPGKPGFFKKIFSKIIKVKISENDFDIYAEELEMLLVENNVALEVAEKVIKELKAEIVGKELLKKEVENEIDDILKKILREILIEPFDLIRKIKNRKDIAKPYVILFVGINGTGKTTTIAKIAHQLKENNLTCILAAADTFRAASIEQIKKHGLIA